MSTLFAISLTTGLLSGIWGWVSISLGLLSWAGFLGCTSYFASPIQGLRGLGVSVLTNLSGVIWALIIIHGSQWLGSDVIGYILTALVSFFMCIQAQKLWLSFIPGTFIGACATFAADGNWQLVMPSLLIGGIFGYSMKVSGLWLQARSEVSLKPKVIEEK